MALLDEFRDVFAWSARELVGIPPEFNELAIELEEGAKHVRQCQYRLNPKYALLVKKDIDKLLEAGFIYPMNHSEWVSPIVMVPKKIGANGKARIRVCQDLDQARCCSPPERSWCAFQRVGGLLLHPDAPRGVPL